MDDKQLEALGKYMMKFFGIGYPRTGTKTLGECFRIFGCKNASWDPQHFKLFENSDINSLMEIARNFDSFEDLPWCLLFKELDTLFPKSKFILTIRKNEDVWFDSWRRHMANRISEHEFHEFGGKVYERKSALYKRHNEEVISYFSGIRAKDLLFLCWETGDGWEKLASFLGKSVPNVPFPHMNKSHRTF